MGTMENILTESNTQREGKCLSVIFSILISHEFIFSSCGIGFSLFLKYLRSAVEDSLCIRRLLRRGI
jgi:hypothetical protein